MGMFDTIKCEVELPGERRPSSSAWLQSKSLECWCWIYTITATGKLVGPRGDESFDGPLNFYAYENDIWFEYEAEFTDGELKGIEVVEISKQGFGTPKEMIYERATRTAGLGR